MDLSILVNVGTLNSPNGSIQGFIQSQAEPSFFVFYNKHNQRLRLLIFVNNMLYVGSNDAIKKIQNSVHYCFDINF
jgi:hypothetical protein